MHELINALRTIIDSKLYKKMFVVEGSKIFYIEGDNIIEFSRSENDLEEILDSISLIGLKNKWFRTNEKVLGVFSPNTLDYLEGATGAVVGAIGSTGADGTSELISILSTTLSCFF